LQAIAKKALLDSGGTFNADKKTVVQQVACDIDPQVEKFILSTQDPQIFCRDVKDMSSSIVWCRKDAVFKGVPNSKICICSWVCHDVFLGCSGHDFEPPLP